VQVFSLRRWSAPFPFPVPCLLAVRLVAAAVATGTSVAMAQPAATAEPAPAPAAAAASGPARTLPAVEVRGAARRGRGAPLLDPITVLSGAALSARSSGTLGATLQDELGVANASFGPGVGLPQIRGQGGARTRVLQGGLGSHDASAISADHAVMAEPAMAERITVHRGPAAILYGGSAIGGAVQIEDLRIPEQLPDQPEGRAEARSSGDADLLLLRTDLAMGPFAMHGDIHRRSTRKVRIPGLALDEVAISSQFGLVNGRNTDGFVGNSRGVTQGGSLGASLPLAAGFVGFNLSTLDSDYGLPPGAHSHGQELVDAGILPDASADVVRIQAGQRRLQLKGAWRPAWALLPQVRAEAARSLYAHDEISGGQVETRFVHRASEIRIEADTRFGAAWSGTLGVHAQRRDFSALGAEAFVPRTQVRGASVFGLQRYQQGAWSVEAGARAERHAFVAHSPFKVLGQPRTLPARSFWPASGSLALRHADAQRSVVVTHWSVARAPDVQELYAGGPHIATRSFDFGNTTLDIETLRGWDLGLEQRWGAWQWRSNLFLYRSDSYIYQRALGWFYEAEEQQAQALCARLDRCFPATKYEQQAARFHGYEAELSWLLPLPGEPRLAVFSDQVRGTLRPGGDVPRLAPQRHGLSLAAGYGAWHTDWRLTRARAQDRPGANETPTRGWTQLNASLRYTQTLPGGEEWSAFVNARNLGNGEVRNSASFLRNYAPEPGRSIQLGLQWVQ